MQPQIKSPQFLSLSIKVLLKFKPFCFNWNTRIRRFQWPLLTLQFISLLPFRELTVILILPQVLPRVLIMYAKDPWNLTINAHHSVVVLILHMILKCVLTLWEEINILYFTWVTIYITLHTTGMSLSHNY